MTDLSEFIKQERAKNPQQSPQSGANVRSSLLALKNAVDGFGSLEGNPLIENIKKVETVVEKKDNNGFIPPVMGNNRPTAKAPVQEHQMMFEEKDDKFTKDLLMKTRQFVTGVPQVQQQPIIKESTIQQISEIQPEFGSRYTNPMQSISPSKNDVMSALKDTITDLYVKEKVEAVIKEYLQTDEGKMLIKSIVVGLFKKK
jgi:hypothetical protein